MRVSNQTNCRAIASHGGAPLTNDDTSPSANAKYLASGEGDTIFAKVTDDSMAPTLNCGDLATIELSENCLRMQDRIWAIVIDGRLLIRRVRYSPRKGREVILMSDNCAVPEYLLSDGEAVMIGRVVAVAKPV